MFYGHFCAHGRLNGPSDFPRAMRRSERWNNFQIWPRRDSNSGDSDLLSNTLPLDHEGALRITEELVSLIAVNWKTTRADVQRTVELVINDIGLKYKQLCGLTIEGAPSMVGRINGVISLMEKARSNVSTINTTIKTHCIIQQRRCVQNRWKYRIWSTLSFKS